MKKSTRNLPGILAAIVSVGIVVAGVSVFASAEETSTPMPEESSTEFPTETPTVDPAPTAEPTETPTEEPTEVPEVEPTTSPSDPAMLPSLPLASTVKGAVTAALSSYCSNPAGSALSPSNWTEVDPYQGSAMGYWEVWGTSNSGQLVIVVQPRESDILVIANSDLTRQAFSAWGCPESMIVGRL
jgi:hypothetical protein